MKKPENTFDDYRDFYQVKIPRRKLIRSLGAASLTSALGLLLLNDTNKYKTEYKKAQELVEAEFPPMDHELEVLSEEYAQQKEKVLRLIQDNKIDEARLIIDTQSFREAYQIELDLEEYRTKKTEKLRKLLDETKSLTRRYPEQVGLVTLTSVTAAAFLWIHDLPGRIRAVRDQELEARQRIEVVYGKKEQFSKEEAVKIDLAFSYLPPIGGKLPLVMQDQSDAGKDYGRFSPSVAAEEQVAEVIKMRRSGELGKAYIHQLTVQGRLPDDFKYAGVSLVLNSPYKNDWEQPFFEMGWGGISPLIHDGGVEYAVNKSINTRWKTVSGRTDFIERAFLVETTPHDEAFSAENPAQKAMRQLSTKREEERILLEAKFYQRAAFALHAYCGTMPDSIPLYIRTSAARIWEKYVQEMNTLLTSKGIEGLVAVTWFNSEPLLDHPVLGDSYGPRHEADYEPIKQQLQHAESIKLDYELQTKNRQIMQNLVDAVGKAIGLPKESSVH